MNSRYHRRKTWASSSDFRRRRRRRSPVWRWIILYLLFINLSAFFVFENTVSELTLANITKIDKLYHAGMFFGVVLVFGLLMRRWMSFGVTALILLNLGVAVEIIQAYQFGRTADFADFVANQVGIVGGLLALFVMDRLAAASRRAEAEERGH